MNKQESKILVIAKQPATQLQQFDNIVVKYALKDIHKPIGVSEYLITKNLPV